MKPEWLSIHRWIRQWHFLLQKLSRSRRSQPSACADFTLTSLRFSNTNFHKAGDFIGANTIPFYDGQVWFFNCHLFMNHPYFPLLVIFGLAAVVVLALLLIASKVGPKSSNPAKADPFESGNPPRGDARIRFSVKFYLVAMLFLIFDLEVVFLYPWAIYFRQLGIFGLVQMGIFLVILTVGYIYVWKKGALEWD
jgi:NADH-quinone oxidoreductase subunit A